MDAGNMIVLTECLRFIRGLFIARMIQIQPPRIKPYIQIGTSFSLK
jgi:hypothetical protein